MDIEQHNEEIQENLRYWENKPLLRQIYKNFYHLIAEHLANVPHGQVVELGSGIGNIKEVVPNCIRTDLFPNPWIDREENAFQLSFKDNEVSDLILFDVFHHLRYPGTALKEFHRVLKPNGRIIIFDPFLSLLGYMLYGLFHHEPIGTKDPIEWFAPEGWASNDIDYYAAQGNASRVFFKKEWKQYFEAWNIIVKKRLSAISYVASGGYSKPQLYPNFTYPMMRGLDNLCDCLPFVLATRLLVVLEKKYTGLKAG